MTDCKLTEILFRHFDHHILTSNMPDTTLTGNIIRKFSEKKSEKKLEKTAGWRLHFLVKIGKIGS